MRRGSARTLFTRIFLCSFWMASWLPVSNNLSASSSTKNCQLILG